MLLYIDVVVDNDQRSASFESAQPIPCNLNEIGEAIDSSLDANKLGVGGFGAVYKVRILHK